MTRNLFIVAGLLLILAVGLFVVGIASAAAVLPLLSISCIMPLFCFFLGGAVFRFTSEYQISPKAQNPARQKMIRPNAQPEPLS